MNKLEVKAQTLLMTSITFIVDTGVHCRNTHASVTPIACPPNPATHAFCAAPGTRSVLFTTQFPAFFTQILEFSRSYSKRLTH